MNNSDIGTIRDEADIKDLFYHDKCDKYDYLIAVGCGAVAGLADIFFVGSPDNSKLVNWTDKQVNKTVKLFAKTCGWSPKTGRNSVSGAIGYLEKRFPVNYDQRHSGDVGGLFRMSSKNHHMKSLAHSPDIVGLFFSILNQFTSTSSFLHDGQLITVKTGTYELQGNNFISKLFCGVANWFGHIMSDIAGSSGASGRGSGVVIPFYEFFQLCDSGRLRVDKNLNTLATVATKVFQEGYDVRFGLTMAIPVLLCDLSIKLAWSIRHYFYYNKPINECIPTKRHDDLRIMLIIGNGMLCLMDGTDAAVRSGGNWVNFFLRFNIIAWFRLLYIVFREVCIRLGISYPLQKQLEAYIRINEALALYLEELEKIDIDRFRKETDKYNIMIERLEAADSENQLKYLLVNEYRLLGIDPPYKGDFNDFMNDSDAVLEFR